MDTTLSLATALIQEAGVEDAWWAVIDQGGLGELLVEINRHRRWQHHRGRRGGRECSTRSGRG